MYSSDSDSSGVEFTPVLRMDSIEMQLIGFFTDDVNQKRNQEVRLKVLHRHTQLATILIPINPKQSLALRQSSTVSVALKKHLYENFSMEELAKQPLVLRMVIESLSSDAGYQTVHEVEWIVCHDYRHCTGVAKFKRLELTRISSLELFFWWTKDKADLKPPKVEPMDEAEIKFDVTAVKDVRNTSQLNQIATPNLMHGTDRVYYHSRTGQPILVNDDDIDSDDETNTLDEAASQHRIDKLSCTDNEKTFMQLWNKHTARARFVCFSHLPIALSNFLDCYGDADHVLENDLYQNFLKFIINLFWINRLELDSALCLIEKLRRALDAIDDAADELQFEQSGKIFQFFLNIGLDARAIAYFKSAYDQANLFISN